MKLKAPDGCHAASLGGLAVPFAEDGTIDVEDKAALAFIVHGFRPIEIGQGAHEAKSKTREANGPNAEAVIPHTGTDGIEGLSRKELFAVLRAKGVSVTLPITNNELRAAVRQSLGS